jgi:serine protease Do
VTDQLQADLAAVVRRVQRATVHVHDGRGRGSGVVWADGLVVTNAHVVQADRPFVETATGRVRGRLLARDERRDLAAIGVDLTGLDAEAAPVRASATLRCGELLLAVGNPFGLSGAVASGVLQRADRRFVVADVRLAPGNSGGPLTDATGRVVGINSMVAGRLALAIPSEAVRAFLARGVSRRAA